MSRWELRIVTFEGEVLECYTLPEEQPQPGWRFVTGYIPNPDQPLVDLPIRAELVELLEERP